MNVTGLYKLGVTIVWTFCQKYLAWWQISDSNHSLMRQFETMIKLVTHSSLLESDDVHLKCLPILACFCDKCDHSGFNDILYLVRQCQRFNIETREMFDEISNIYDESGKFSSDSPCDLLYILLRKKY